MPFVRHHSTALTVKTRLWLKIPITYVCLLII